LRIDQEKWQTREMIALEMGDQDHVDCLARDPCAPQRRQR
jgi:hypothetical protein